MFDLKFPLIKLAKKLKGSMKMFGNRVITQEFPLIKLAKKLKDFGLNMLTDRIDRQYASFH